MKREMILMMKKQLELVGKAMLASANYHLQKPNTYLAASAIGLGAGWAHKSVQKGLTTGLTVAWGIVAYGSFEAMDIVNERTNSEED